MLSRALRPALLAWRVPWVPYQALPLLHFFANNVCAGEVYGKGEVEPGNEASTEACQKLMHGVTVHTCGGCVYSNRLWYLSIQFIVCE